MNDNSPLKSLEKKQSAEVDYLHRRGSIFNKRRPCNLFIRSLIDPSQRQKHSGWMINIHMCNSRSKIIIATRTKQKQMSLKFGKTIRTLRVSQNCLVLKKSVIKIVNMSNHLN